MRKLPAPPFKTVTGHLIWDEWAIEQETGELLYGLARALKPDLVIESGTGRGIATVFLALAVEQNEKGRIVTYEPDPEFRAKAEELFASDPVVTVMEGDSTDTPERPDLVFVDCYGGFRDKVIRHWLTTPGPLIVIHDAVREYPFHLGEGTHIPGHDGVWIGRAKEKGDA